MDALIELGAAVMKTLYYFLLPFVARRRLLGNPTVRQMLLAARQMLLAASQGGVFNYDVCDAGYILAAGGRDFSPAHDPQTTAANVELFRDMVRLGLVEHQQGLRGLKPGVYRLTARGWNAVKRLTTA